MSPLLVLGLSYRTAPVQQREKASLAAPAARALLRSLRADAAVSGCAVICTCNRTEIAAVAADPAALSRALVAHSRITAFELARASYLFAGEDAARHLFRVAASLDSMVVGESEIQGQVRAARELARDAGTLGPQLDRAFACALRAGGRARAQTRLAAGAVSVSSVAVEFARDALGDLDGSRALLVGAGRAAEATARALLGHGVSEIVVANRSPLTATRLAARFGGRAVGLEDLTRELRAADVVVSSTNAPGTVIDARHVPPGRRILIDIAVPRDIDPRAGDVRGARLHNIDDLERVVMANLDGRRREAARAEAIVEHELQRFIVRDAEAA
jgi:glutamyl-tRNA reductase